ncbi:TetR family transcriptional regulator [Rhodococcus sp. ACT016]|uniref:TetR family transcriptional regulator n=1 Tax=Rhodococcus sp. ACT016 TaxID=3134808 RepID=UPI003D27744B
MKITGGATGRPRAGAIDESLVVAFEELIAENPLREFSVRALVARAGTTPDAFYRRYASLGTSPTSTPRSCGLC